jgi:hypothetical protein
MLRAGIAPRLAALATLAAATGSPPAAPAQEAYGYLRGPVRGPDGGVRHERQAYRPRPGDLVLYSADSVMWRAVYALARTGPPFHVGIVVALPDGRPAVLEAGAYDRDVILLADLGPRLRSHDGTIWVRRLRAPLGTEASARLTTFALEQTQKRYALLRVSLEITPFGAHGPLRSRLFGSARLDRPRWFCSELAVAAAAVAGLLDPAVVKPNTVYPRDLYTDRPHDLSPVWEGPALWSPAP